MVEFHNINFISSTSLSGFHKFWCIAFLFSFMDSKYFLMFLKIFSLNYRLNISLLLNFHIFPTPMIFIITKSASLSFRTEYATVYHISGTGCPTDTSCPRILINSLSWTPPTSITDQNISAPSPQCHSWWVLNDSPNCSKKSGNRPGCLPLVQSMTIYNSFYLFIISCTWAVFLLIFTFIFDFDFTESLLPRTGSSLPCTGFLQLQHMWASLGAEHRL